jgi:hypothetical protein
VAEVNVEVAIREGRSGDRGDPLIGKLKTAGWGIMVEPFELPDTF